MGKGCGGGGLRLLPHKSWNVWNSDNVSRVERDEQQHAQQQQHKQQRERLALHTQRINTLRSSTHSPHDSGEQPEEAVAVANEEEGRSGTERVVVAGQQSFGQFATEGGQPWYLRGELEKRARGSRQERTRVEQQQHKSRAEAVLRRIRRKEEERKEGADDIEERHVRLGELLGGEKKEADDPLDVMRYYVQRTKQHQRLHQLVFDSTPPPPPPQLQTDTTVRAVKRQHGGQAVEVIELSSGSEGSDSGSSERRRRRRREKHRAAKRHRRRSDGRRSEEEEVNERSRKRRRREEREQDEEDEDEKRRRERRTQIVELLQQFDR